MMSNKGKARGIFSGIVMVGISEEVTLEQRPRCNEQAIRVFLGRGNSKYKGTEIDFLLSWRNLKVVSVDGEQSARGGVIGN